MAILLRPTQISACTPTPAFQAASITSLLRNRILSPAKSFETRIRYDLLKSRTVAESVEADVSPVEVVANVTEFVVELALILAYVRAMSVVTDIC